MVEKRGGKTSLIVIVIALVIIAIGGVIFTKLGKTEPKSSTSQETANIKDTDAPTINLTNISDGQELSGVITLSVLANDDTGVAKVEYFLNSSFVSVTYATPFNFVLDTTKYTNGSYTILAKAYDKAGNVTETKTLTFIINNPNQETTTQASSSPKKKATVGSISTTSSHEQQSAGPQSSGDENPEPEPEPDTEAPTTPSNFSIEADGPYISLLSWDESTDNAEVSGYYVYRDGDLIDTADDNEFTDYTVVPGNIYEYSVVAFDSSDNSSDPTNDASITMESTSIWSDADTPESSVNDSGSIELGVKFRPKVNGQLTGIKFYKPSGATGSHTGSLWTIGGSNLATGTSTSETASGWQTITFDTPATVTAGTTYIASYYSTDAFYAYISSYFATQGISSQYLDALATGVVGNNGVYKVGTSGFPNTGSGGSTSYMVDVTFTPAPDSGGPTVTATDNTYIYPDFPGSNNTGVPAGKRLPIRDRGLIMYQTATVEDMEIQDTTSYKCIDVRSNNSIIRNVKITCSGLHSAISQNVSNTGLLVEDAELNGNGVSEQGCINPANYTARRLNIYHCNDGAKMGDNTTIESSFIHHLNTANDCHCDGVQSTGGDNISLQNNTIDVKDIISEPAVSAIMLGDEHGALGDITISGNFLAGGGYTLYGGYNTFTFTHPSSLIVTNNRFGISNEGPYSRVHIPTSTWTNNVWDDSNLQINL